MKLIAVFVVGCIIASPILAGIESLLGKGIKRFSKDPHEEKKQTPEPSLSRRERV